jgi:hypothetical protein
VGGVAYVHPAVIFPGRLPSLIKVPVHAFAKVAKSFLRRVSGMCIIPLKEKLDEPTSSFSAIDSPPGEAKCPRIAVCWLKRQHSWTTRHRYM